MDEPQVEVLTDLAEANEVLTAAFLTDPGVDKLLGRDGACLRKLYDLIVPRMLRDPDSILLGVRNERGLASVAVCQGCSRQIPLWRMAIPALPMIWGMGLRRTRRMLKFGKELDENSPLRPGNLRLAILGTRPDAFGCGYGTALLRRLEQHALSRGLTAVYLEAASHHYPKRLYERHGYQTVKRFDTIAGSVDLMVKSLDDAATDARDG